MFTLLYKRLVKFHSCFFAIILIAGCTSPATVQSQKDINNKTWSGRISLQVQSDAVQSFSGGFELKGQAENGELTLISPLGNVISILRWSPGEALLDSGHQKTQRFSSIDELMAQATGAVMPIGALFSWLQGNNANVNGWSADLSQYGDGRISAKRVQPQPSADLRVVLDQ